MVPQPVSKFLGRYSLITGCLVIGGVMAAVFGTVGIGSVVLLSVWNSSYPALVDIMGSNVHTGRNEMLESVYPGGMVAATCLFFIYAISGIVLIVGVRKNEAVLVKAFLLITVITVVLCLIGHFYIFLEFPWYKTYQLVLTIVVNAIWYVWWFYCLLVVLSYVIDTSSTNQESLASNE